ncbi:MAG: fibronectin type III domain-containing protein [Spirochaetaceae bacterium]|nr:fibronectin type III domain-containing protein [Spirochaetaceae bacterium]
MKLSKRSIAWIIPLFLALLFVSCDYPLGGTGDPWDIETSTDTPSAPEDVAVPAAPARPTVTPASRQLTVTWTPVEDATAYEVYYGTINDSGSARKMATNPTAPTAIITALTNGTPYYVWIKAVIDGTAGDFSPMATATPISAASVPAVPTVTVVPTTSGTPPVTVSGSLTVTWTPVAGATAYQVWMALSNNSALAEQRGTDITDSLSTTITGLTDGIPYYIWVKSKNSKGTSVFGSPITGTPKNPTSTLDSPVINSVTPGSGKLIVTWDAVNNATAYEVYYGSEEITGTSLALGIITVSAGTSSSITYTITGLTNDKQYEVWVKAKNSLGTGPASKKESGTPQTVPLLPPPDNVTVTPDNAKLTVSWDAVTDATGYEIWVGTTDVSSATTTIKRADAAATATSATISSLTNFTTYYVWVRTKSADGTGDFAASGTTGTPATVPAAPGRPTVTAASGQLTVSWAAVSGATDYEVWLGISSDTSLLSAARTGLNITGDTTKTTIINGLSNGILYYVWVKAKNAVGTSGFSQSATGTPTAATGAPSAPTGVTVTPGNKKLDVSWGAVTGATSYLVVYSTVNDVSLPAKTPQEVSEPSYQITGLTNGTPYYVWVRSKNSAGTSTATAASGAPHTPNITLLDPPDSVTVEAPESGKLTVTWEWDEEPPAGVTGYEIWAGTENDSAKATKRGTDAAATATSATITGLTNFTEHYVWVRTKSVDGTGPFDTNTSVPSGTPGSNLPAAPDNVTVTSPGSGKLTITWSWTSSAPADVTGYEIWVGTTDDSSATTTTKRTDASSSPATITGLTNGTTYYVWVRTKNAYGTGPFAEEGETGTPALAPPEAPSTAPTVTVGNASLAVTWTAVTGATSYDVYVGEDSSTTPPTTPKAANVTGSTHTINGLTNGTDYYVWIKAKNADGVSDFSDPSEAATPIGVPVAPAEVTAGPANTPVSGNLTVTWDAVTAQAAPASAYEVWYGTASSSGSATKFGDDIEGGTTTTATITGLTNDTLYYVWVKAKNAVGTSGFSTTAASGRPAETGTVVVDVSPTTSGGTPNWSALAIALGSAAANSTIRIDGLPTTLDAAALNYIAAFIEDAGSGTSTKNFVLNLRGYTATLANLVSAVNLTEHITGLILPNVGTSITANAFTGGGCAVLESITIPSNVTSITAGAFSGCENLKNIFVDLGNSAYSDTDGVLYNYAKTSLVQYPVAKTGTSFSIPATVTSIGASAFSGAANLTSVTIPTAVSSIGASAFKDSGLTSVIIPLLVTKIETFTFSGCTSLTTVTLKSLLTSIEASAFQGCTSLASITIPAAVTTIGASAFQGCTSLTSITIPAAVTTIGAGAFTDAGLTTVIFSGDSVSTTSIQNAGFQGPATGDGSLSAAYSTGKAGTYTYAAAWTKSSP